MVVVIPCHDEPDLVGALERLANCEPPLGQAEVIVVINGSETVSYTHLRAHET